MKKIRLPTPAITLRMLALVVAGRMIRIRRMLARRLVNVDQRPKTGKNLHRYSNLYGGTFRKKVPARRPTLRLAAWLLIAVAIGCARRAPPAPVSPPSAGAPVPPLLRQRYSGTYVYAGGEEERAAVARAVDRAVEDMSFLARGFARSALMDRAAVRESYTIFFDEAGRLGVLSPGELPEVSPADGTPVQVVNRLGDESELTQQFIDGVLVQRGRTADGGGSTAFDLQPDGQTLLVRRTMDSSKLTQPVKYTLTYRRR